MFGLIRNLFRNEERVEMKSDVVKALESAVSEKDCRNVVDRAVSLRNLLRSDHRTLTNDEKVRIVKALNKAKVRALMGGTSESYSVFSSLNSISSDVVQLL